MTKQEADVLATKAHAIRLLVDAGFNPDAVIDSVEAGTLNSLKGHHDGRVEHRIRQAS